MPSRFLKRRENACQPMRLLLDESLPRRFRLALPNHQVRTVVEMGWSGTKNGQLLALGSIEFDAFITVDKNLPRQQNVSTIPIAVIVLDVRSNDLTSLLDIVAELENALVSLEPRQCLVVKARD